MTPPGPPPQSTAPVAAPELFCPQCGYSLRGIDSPRCPECGLEIDRAKLSLSQIPWVHRNQIGRIRAFVHTAWMATLSPRRLANEMALPVSYRDAQLFRWIVVAVAALPLAITTIVLRLIAGHQIGVSGLADALGLSGTITPLADWGICLAAAYWLWPVPSILLVLLLAAVTGAAGYFFHPASLPVIRQNRAVALSLYCCGPLAWLPIPAAVTGALLALGAAAGTGVEPVIAGIVLMYLAFLLIGLFSWLNTVRLLRMTTHCSPARTLAALVGLPVLWLVLAGLILALLPAAIGFLTLMCLSYSAHSSLTG